MYVRVTSLGSLKDIIHHEDVIWVGYKADSREGVASFSHIEVAVRTKTDFFVFSHSLRKQRITQMVEYIWMTSSVHKEDNSLLVVNLKKVHKKFSDVCCIDEDLDRMLPEEFFDVLERIIWLKSEGEEHFEIKRDTLLKLREWLNLYEKQRIVQLVLGELNVPSRINIYSDVVVVRECDCE